MTIQEWRDQLAGIDAALASAPEGPNRRSLLQLREDMALALLDQERPVLDVAFEGALVEDRRIRVSAASRLLTGLQGAITAAGQALTGEATARGAIPVHIADATEFRLEAVFTGSFGFRLRAPAETAEQETLPGTEGTTRLLEWAVDRVLDILEASADDRPESAPALVERIVPLGQRTFGRLREFAETVVATDARTLLSWRSPAAPERTAEFQRRAATYLRDLLSSMRMTEETVVLRGHLGTVSDIRDLFELRTATGEIIRGQVAADLVPELGRYYGRNVEASLTVTIGTSETTGLERRSYRLDGLSASRQDELPEGG